MPARFKKNHCKDTGQSKRKKCAMKCERYIFHIFYKKVQKKTNCSIYGGSMDSDIIIDL